MPGIDHAVAKSGTYDNSIPQRLYNGMMDQAMEEAESNGVHVYRDIDKTAFIQAVQPIHNKFCAKGESYKALYDDIQKYAE